MVQQPPQQQQEQQQQEQPHQPQQQPAPPPQPQPQQARPRPPRYACTNVVREGHGRPLYCVAFNNGDPQNSDLFATCGGQQATVYRLHRGGGCGGGDGTAGASTSSGANATTTGRIEVLQTYADRSQRAGGAGADKGRESLYVVRWTHDAASGAPLLLAAGALGVLRVINVLTRRTAATLIGHGNAINDVAVHPRHAHLVLTASQDSSIRLWNIATKTCPLVMRGPGGHSGEAFALDFHPWDPYRFVSGGMDGVVKVWSLQAHWHTVRASDAWAAPALLLPPPTTPLPTPGRAGPASPPPPPPAASLATAGSGLLSPSATTTSNGAIAAAAAAVPAVSFRTRVVQHPIFSSARVHGDYVDCVRWLGDLVLSKTVDFRVRLWRPLYNNNTNGSGTGAGGAGAGGAGSAGGAGGGGGGSHFLETSCAYELLSVVEIPGTPMWWDRFSTNPACTVLALGNTHGRTYVWRPSDPAPRPQLLKHPDCNAVVRQTAVSADGRTVLCATDDGVLWRWDLRADEGGGGAGPKAATQQRRQQQQQAGAARRAGAANGGGGGDSGGALDSVRGALLRGSSGGGGAAAAAGRSGFGGSSGGGGGNGGDDDDEDDDDDDGLGPRCDAAAAEAQACAHARAQRRRRRPARALNGADGSDEDEQEDHDEEEEDDEEDEDDNEIGRDDDNSPDWGQRQQRRRQRPNAKAAAAAKRRRRPEANGSGGAGGGGAGGAKAAGAAAAAAAPAAQPPPARQRRRQQSGEQ